MKTFLVLLVCCFLISCSDDDEGGTQTIVAVDDGVASHYEAELNSLRPIETLVISETPEEGFTRTFESSRTDYSLTWTASGGWLEVVQNWSIGGTTTYQYPLGLIREMKVIHILDGTKEVALYY